jgi:predicted flap endonuclease-1-like 5' DNA nuclease
MALSGGVLWWLVLGALLGWVAAWWLGRSAQRLLAEPVVRIVERRVDNPQHMARIAALQDEVAQIPALQARIDELLAAPPRVVEKVVTRTLDRVIEKPVDRIVEKVIERPVPDVAALAARDAALRTQRLRLDHLEALAAVLAERVGDVPAVETPSAEAQDDLECIDGIGPEIAALLREHDLGSFARLAESTPEALRDLLDAHGSAFPPADPGTWPEQARLAADGRHDELKTLQDTLRAARG